jgi:hypothetical protein
MKTIIIMLRPTGWILISTIKVQNHLQSFRKISESSFQRKAFRVLRKTLE